MFLVLFLQFLLLKFSLFWLFYSVLLMLIISSTFQDCVESEAFLTRFQEILNPETPLGTFYKLLFLLLGQKAVYKNDLLCHKSH